MFASLFQKLINNCPNERRHIKALRTLNAFDHIQYETGGLKASITQKELKKFIFKIYLEMNIRKWDEIIKRDTKKQFYF